MVPTFEMVVVERKANAVQAESAEKLGVGVHEKILEELGNLFRDQDVGQSYAPCQKRIPIFPPQLLLREPRESGIRNPDSLSSESKEQISDGCARMETDLK